MNVERVCNNNDNSHNHNYNHNHNHSLGDLLSPYSFVVAVETLAIAIRQNAAIKGISIGKEDTKLL